MSRLQRVQIKQTLELYRVHYSNLLVSITSIANTFLLLTLSIPFIWYIVLNIKLYMWNEQHRPFSFGIYHYVYDWCYSALISSASWSHVFRQSCALWSWQIMWLVGMTYVDILLFCAISLVATLWSLTNTLRLRQNGRHSPDDIFRCIFLNENVCSLINISLKFVPKGQINNIPTLVQIMAWRWPDNKPLSKPMMFNLLTHICITQPQWVNANIKVRAVASFSLL